MRMRRFTPCFPALVLLLVGGCYRHTPLEISPRQLHEHKTELQRTGEAKIAASPDKTLTVRMTDTFVVTLFPAGGGPLPPNHEDSSISLSVEELLANCPDVMPARGGAAPRDPPCLLLDVANEALPAGTQSHFDGRRTRYALAGVGLLGLSAGAATCIGKCDTPLSVISVPTAIVAGVVGVIVLIGVR